MAANNVGAPWTDVGSMNGWVAAWRLLTGRFPAGAHVIIWGAADVRGGAIHRVNNHEQMRDTLALIADGAGDLDEARSMAQEALERLEAE